MKKLFLIAFAILLFCPRPFLGKTVPENVTVTAQTADPVDVTKNVPFGVGTDGKDHRFAVNNSGAFIVAGASTSPAAQTAGPALPPGLTFTPVAIAGPYDTCLTFTATGAAVNGAQLAAAVSGWLIVVTSYSISTDTNALINIHHQSGALSRSSTGTSNWVGGGWFAGGLGEHDSGAMVKPGFNWNEPLTVDVSAACTNVFVGAQYFLVK